MTFQAQIKAAAEKMGMAVENPAPDGGTLLPERAKETLSVTYKQRMRGAVIGGRTLRHVRDVGSVALWVATDGTWWAGGQYRVSGPFSTDVAAVAAATAYHAAANDAIRVMKDWAFPMAAVIRTAEGPFDGPSLRVAVSAPKGAMQFVTLDPHGPITLEEVARLADAAGIPRWDLEELRLAREQTARDAMAKDARAKEGPADPFKAVHGHKRD